MVIDLVLVTALVTVRVMIIIMTTQTNSEQGEERNGNVKADIVVDSGAEESLCPWW